MPANNHASAAAAFKVEEESKDLPSKEDFLKVEDVDKDRWPECLNKPLLAR